VRARDRILLISLWLSVVTLTTWVGGTLYQALQSTSFGALARACGFPRGPCDDEAARRG
jgi:hypothetical protein